MIRIVFINKKQNEGIASAVNSGLDISKGKYIARMDADDESLPERFKFQIDFMEKNQDIDVLGTAMFIVNDMKKIISKINKRPTRYNDCLNMLITEVCCWNPTVMIRKTVLNGIRYDEQYLVAEDYKLWVDLAKSGAKFANSDIPLLNYHWHGENISITKKDAQDKTAQKIRREYMIHFLGSSMVKLHQETLESLFFNTNKTVSFKALSRFYDTIE